MAHRGQSTGWATVGAEIARRSRELNKRKAEMEGEFPVHPQSLFAIHGGSETDFHGPNLVAAKIIN